MPLRCRANAFSALSHRNLPVIFTLPVPLRFRDDETRPRPPSVEVGNEGGSHTSCSRAATLSLAA